MDILKIASPQKKRQASQLRSWKRAVLHGVRLGSEKPDLDRWTAGLNRWSGRPVGVAVGARGFGQFSILLGVFGGTNCNL